MPAIATRNGAAPRRPLCAKSKLMHCNMIDAKRKTATRRPVRNLIRCFDQAAAGAKGFINPPSRSSSSATRAAMAFSSRQLASFGRVNAAASFTLSSSIKSISPLLALPVPLSCCGDKAEFAISAISTACTSRTVAADVSLSSVCSTVSVAHPVAARSAPAARSASAAQAIAAVSLKWSARRHLFSQTSNCSHNLGSPRGRASVHFV